MANAKRRAARRQARRVLAPEREFIERGLFKQSALDSLAKSQRSIAKSVEKITERKRQNRALRKKRA